MEIDDDDSGGLDGGDSDDGDNSVESDDSDINVSVDI